MSKVRSWLDSLLRPDGMSDSDYASFIRFTTKFFLCNGKLWRKDSSGCHKLVTTPVSRYTVLVSAHNDVAHKGFYATHGLITEQFWWPVMHGDIAWFVHTCQPWQLRQMCNVLIPPVVANPAPLFAKVYANTMHLPSQTVASI